jgi:hypothetical protein
LDEAVCATWPGVGAERVPAAMRKLRNRDRRLSSTPNLEARSLWDLMVLS